MVSTLGDIKGAGSVGVVVYWLEKGRVADEVKASPPTGPVKDTLGGTNEGRGVWVKSG